MFPHRTYSGRISYKHPDGRERGREWFSGTVHEHGRIVRAWCEIDDARLVRDTNWTLDADFMPIDGFARVLEDSRITGASWFRFDGAEVRCESTTEAYGQVSQTYRSDAPFTVLGLHPLVGDGLVVAPRGADNPGEEVFLNSITCSFSPNGETGMIAHPLQIGVRYVGEEEVSVPAGQFLARHYEINWQRRWTPADYWTFGDDYVFVKMRWNQFGTASELVEFNPG